MVLYGDIWATNAGMSARIDHIMLKPKRNLTICRLISKENHGVSTYRVDGSWPPSPFVMAPRLQKSDEDFMQAR